VASQASSSTAEELLRCASVQEGDENEALIKATLHRIRVSTFCAISETMRKQGNLHVARVFLRQAMQTYGDVPQPFSVLSAMLRHMLSAAMMEQSAATRASKLVTALSQVREKAKSPICMGDWRHRQTMLLLEAKMCARLAGLLHHHHQATGLLSAVKEQCQKNYPLKCGREGFATSLYVHANSNYVNATKLFEEHLEGGSIRGDSAASVMEKAFLRHGRFCHNVLKTLDHSECTRGPLAALPGTLTRTLLHAMRLGGEKGGTRVSEYFPIVLCAIGQFAEARQEFLNHVDAVPKRAFLPWISHLLASLNSIEGKTVLNLVEKVCKEYPADVYHAINVAADVFNDKHSSVSPEKSFPASLSLASFSHQSLQNCTGDTAVSAAVFEQLLPPRRREREFSIACDLLTAPHHRFKEWLQRFKAQLAEVSTGSGIARLRRIVQQTEDNCFDESNTFFGDVNIAFARSWSNKFDLIVGRHGSRVNEHNAASIFSSLTMLSRQMDEAFRAERKRADKATQYSPWFLQTVGYYRDILIPGHTHALSEFPTHIASFNNQLLTLHSLRQPKRLTIRGDDDKLYNFLIKGGEDLRLDQRVQQLFTVMNGVFSRSHACRSRDLHVVTYNVVPMGLSVGAVEWVDNTTPFKEVITTQWDKAIITQQQRLALHSEKDGDIELEPKRNSSELTGAPRVFSFQDVVEKQKEWLLRLDETSPLEQFKKQLLTVTPNSAKNQLKSLHSMFPPSLLRRAVLSQSDSQESYFLLRKIFISTLAATCVSGYVLGIGDRHLENFLLKTTSGAVVPIDFGHAFGSATMLLAVPELVPFRLTRQLTEFIPTSVGSILNLHIQMETALTALSHHQDILLSIMDIFVKEPLLNWDLLEKDRDNGELKSKKLEIAKLKLNKANPAFVMQQELVNSKYAKAPKLLGKLIEIVRGMPVQENLRSSTADICESFTEQVNLLIEQATDQNILARTYIGWMPWI
jgi:DNA-dependent protein kinase catalytic subunit